MNRKRSNGSAALTPLPKSAVAASRASGVSCSPGSSGWRRRIHTRAGPSAAGSSSQRISIALAAKLASPASSSAKRTGLPALRRRERLACAAAVGARPARRRLGHARLAIACTRSALARQTTSPPRPSSSAPALSSAGELLHAAPGAHDPRGSVSGASGIGRRNSKPRRATRSSRAGLAGARRRRSVARRARRRAARRGPTARARARSA